MMSISTLGAPLPHDDAEPGMLARARDSIWNRWHAAREAPRALGAAHHELDVALIGTVGYYVDAHARGRPIVLLHDLYPGASAYDVAPLNITVAALPSNGTVTLADGSREKIGKIVNQRMAVEVMSCDPELTRHPKFDRPLVCRSLQSDLREKSRLPRPAWSSP